MAVANVVLNTKTYAFSSDQSGIITWLEKSGGVPTGYQRLTASIKDSTKADVPVRIQWTLFKPIVAAADSSCSCTGEVLRSSNCRINIEMPTTGSLAERTDLALCVKDLAANAQFQSMITDLVRPG